MTDRSLDAASQHRRAWEVIPWVVNGSASAEQRSLLDAHLKGCEDCRQELMRQREWQAAMASAASPAVGDVESGLQRLLARIDGASGSGQAAAAGAASPQRRRAAPSSLTQWLAAAVVVEALALAALSIGLVMRPDPAAGYETLSQTAPTPRGATIRIVPAPSLRLDDLQRLLDKLKLQIVAGPNSAGAYDLAPRAEQPARELQLSTLRADAGLRFVEPIESRRIAAMKSMQPLLAAITVVLCLAGCANVPAVEPRAEWRAMRERPERLIVVAVANPKASASIVAGSTTAGYASLQPYLASAHARQVIDALKRSHRLTEVAAWPIQALRVHCAVLEVPAGVSRDELVRTLSHDARIEIVQPLQDFEALGRIECDLQRPLRELAARLGRGRGGVGARRLARARRQRCRHRHRRRRRAPRSAGPHRQPAQPGRPRRRAARPRPPRHRGRRGDRGGGQQPPGHCRHRSGSHAQDLQGLLAARERRRALQLVHARTRAGRKPGGRRAGHQPEPGRARATNCWLVWSGTRSCKGASSSAPCPRMDRSTVSRSAWPA